MLLFAPAALQPPVRSRLRDVQMHAIVYAPDANGGPGTAKYELTPDMLNLAWQKTLNMPGQAAFTMLRFNKKLSDIAWMQDHLKLFRETSAGVKCVWAGKLVKPSEGVRDTIVTAIDYMGFLQFGVTGFRTLYPNKLIGSEIVLPEWQAEQTKTKGALNFVQTGTIENPFGLDGTTPMKTNEQFGVVLFHRLFLFYALAELAMANTDNSTIFEITDEAPHVFNFWGNRSIQRTLTAFTYPGNIMEYLYEPGYDQRRNELVSPISDGSGGQSTYTADDQTDWNTYRRLTEAVTLKTLIGINTATVETDQQKAGLQRLLTEKLRQVRLAQVYPRQGEFDPFVNWQLGDQFRHTFQKSDRSGDAFDGWLQTVSIAASWTPDSGELLSSLVRSLT